MNKTLYMRNYMKKYNLNKIECPCGSIISKGKYSGHLKSNRHTLYEFRHIYPKNELKEN